MLNLLWMGMMAGGILFSAFHGTLSNVTESLMDSSEEAINLCIFMLGVIGMWNGMMEIAVKSGLMRRIAHAMRPVIRWLFPEIPAGHEAGEYIAANMTANILGLGWAATPAGLKAMKALRRLRKPGETAASDAMCAFLVINISSLQLIPINMIAYRGQYGSVNPSSIVLPSLLATVLSTLAGVFFIKCVEMRGRRRKKKERGGAAL